MSSPAPSSGRRAEEAMAAGRPLEALSFAWPMVDRASHAEGSFERALRVMARAFQALGNERAALTIHLYLGEVDRARELGGVAPTDRARCAAASGTLDEASREFQREGWFGHAALALERAGDVRGARVLWERFLESSRLATEPYVHGLVRFNLARTCEVLGDAAEARRARVECVHLLGEAADRFEGRGERERAFDCFQVILSLGRTGAFENLAEGYLNCIRILREDHLRYYALRYYEDFQTLALERGELRAAATLYREAADYARQQGLPYERHYLLRAAQVEVTAAEKMLRSLAPLELVESAVGAAIEAYNELGTYSKVVELYGRLADLPLSEARRSRYRQLCERLAGIPDEPGPKVVFPEHLRIDAAYPEVWNIDVIEWEQGGDAAETMGEVLDDSRWPVSTRRLALLARLHALGSLEADPTRRAAGLAARLGRVGLYAALAPLERLYAEGDVPVRVACLRAVRELFFKRSFGLVGRGLADADPAVRSEAVFAVEDLHFPHAFDPLVRIHRESRDEAARTAALRALARIASPEAREWLATVARQGDAGERALAKQLLSRTAPSGFNDT